MLVEILGRAALTCYFTCHTKLNAEDTESGILKPNPEIFR
jgi:hypothetical protein